MDNITMSLGIYFEVKEQRYMVEKAQSDTQQRL